MDLTQVTLTQMRYATAVVETGSFRAASDACYVSQSGLSMQVAKLEELLGTVLFDRSKKPVLLTREGERAVAQMRSILRETARLGRIVAEETEPAGTYRLGVIPSLSPTVLPLCLPAFIEAFPRVELVVEELKTEEILLRLAADTLDAGIAATPLDVDGVQEHPLGLERMMAYLPPGDPLLKKKRIRQSELEPRALWVMSEGHCFRHQVLSYCGTDTRSPNGIRFESGSFETLVRLVDGGVGATVLPELTAAALSEDRHRQLRPLVDPTPVREIGIVTARADLRRRVTEAFASTAKRQLATVLQREPKQPRVLHPLS